MKKATIDENRRCPKCGKTENQIRVGYIDSGTQRCKCKDCNLRYTLNPKSHAYSEETKDQEEGSREGMPLLEDTAEHPPAEEGGPPARESPPGTEEVTDIPADSISITIDDGASSGAEDISADNPEDIFNTTEDLSPDGSEETAYDTGSDLSVSADREGAVFCAADAGADEQNPAADADTRDDTAKDGLTDEEDGHTYYYKDGARQTGFVSHDGMVLYFDEDGRMVRGRALIDGTLFWFHEDTGDMARSSWVRHDGGMYYYDSDGHAAAGFNDIGGKLYFFDTDGRKQDFRGWETINGTAYYFDADGVMVTGEIELTLEFDSSGRLIGGTSGSSDSSGSSN